MSVFVQGRVPRNWNDETVSHVTRRLIALERELAGGRDRFLSPAIPSFGSGTITGGAGATSPIAVAAPVDGGDDDVTTVVATGDWELPFMVMGA